jgi:hypothetical protein
MKRHCEPSASVGEAIQSRPLGQRVSGGHHKSVIDMSASAILVLATWQTRVVSMTVRYPARVLTPRVD